MQKESFLNNILILFHAITKKKGLELSNFKNNAKKNTIKLAHWLMCYI